MFKSLFKRTDRVGHMRSELSELVDILEAAGQAPGWAERARDALSISDEALLCQRVQSWFGGMGSLNDLVLKDPEQQLLLEKTIGNLTRWSSSTNLRRRDKRQGLLGKHRRSTRMRTLPAKELQDLVTQRTLDGFAVHEIDCQSEPKMMAGFAMALQWEEQFGYTPDALNLDALHDAFSGFPNKRNPRMILVFQNFEDMERHSSARAAALVCLLEDNAAMAAAAGYDLVLIRCQAQA